jgi:Na+/proline symporter
MLSLYDYLMIGFYFAFLMSVGFVFKHLNKGGTDFFAGGRRMNWWLLGASSLVSNFSAWSFTGAASIAYSYGIIFFSIFVIDIVGFTISFIWFAPWFRRLRLVTAMDAVRLRFGKGNEQFFTWLQIITSYFAGSIWLVGLSVVIAAVTPISQVTVILGSGAAILVLATIGGKWGITANDFVQLVLLICCAIGVTALTLYHVGGIGALFANLPKDHFNMFRPLGSIKYDWLYVGAALIWGIYQKNSIIFGAAKYITAKDDKHARKSVLIPLIGYCILPVFWFIPAVGALIIVPDLMTEYSQFSNPAEASYIAVCIELLPAGMLGLMVAALFAATMSSMDTGLNVNAGFLVKNFYQPIFRPNASEMELQRAGQVATLLSGGVMMGLAILIVNGGKVTLFDAYLYLSAYIQAPLTVCLFMGILIHRTPAWSAWVSVVFGILTTLFLFNVVPMEFMGKLLRPVIGDWFYTYLQTNKFTFTNLITVPATSLVFFSTRYFYHRSHRSRNKEQYDASLDEFSRRIATPVDFESEVGGDNTAHQALTIGTLCMVYGGVVMLGVLIPNPISGRIVILGCAAFMFSIGLCLYLYGRTKRPQPMIA